jgi:hypothetical protein
MGISGRFEETHPGSNDKKDSQVRPIIFYHGCGEKQQPAESGNQ